MSELFFVLIFSIMNGFAWKVGDLLGEHGLEWFRGSRLIIGFVSGLSFVGLMLIADVFVIHSLATVLYWLLRVKLEYFNHTIGAVITLVTGFIYFPYLWDSSWGDFSLVLCIYLGWYIISGYINTYFKLKFSENRGLMKFLRLRLRFYVAPLILSIISGEYLLIFSFIVIMAVTEVLTAWFESFLKRQPCAFESLMKFRVRKTM